MGRLILVSNRLPVRLREVDGDVLVERTAGGLATGLAGPHRARGGPWVGWLGRESPIRAAAESVRSQLQRWSIVPVELSEEEVEEYYEQFSNQILWPTFHYQIGRRPIDARGWDAYQRVNAKFAHAVVEQYRAGDLIWVHDYHLMLVPQLLRQQLPEAQIGFFLHIPFPSSEVFATLPMRSELLRGILDANLIGFHSPSYLRHFSTTLRRVLGLEPVIDRVRWEGRDVRIGTFPMGVDADGWTWRARSLRVSELMTEYETQPPEQKLLLGLDRMDYTKGIPRRLLAIERLLEHHPELVGRIRLVQVSAPSRETTDGYIAFERELAELVGRINARWATPTWVPIHHIHRGFDQDHVAALYRSADVMLVTPTRDGMNLVAMEFVASRVDEDGVLVLSEFAGAAAELGAALQVNPYDIDGMADRIFDALTMSATERRRRMMSMRTRVQANTVQRWATLFIDALEQTGSTPLPVLPDPLSAAKAALSETGRLHLLLDYDGTLVPFASSPDLAVPDSALVALLTDLGSRNDISVEIVTGRSRESIEPWFQGVPVGLHAEHGLWSKWRGDANWSTRAPIETGWKASVRHILSQFTESTPGSLIEEKTSSLAWHYRLATADSVGDHDLGEHRARELRLLLTELLSNEPVQVVVGNRVVEIRPHGVSKGAVATELLGRTPGLLPSIIAIGDDVTDEDLYAVLPPPSITINVGDRPSAARGRLGDVRDVRDFLTELARLESPSA